jgi:dimethylargininase
MSRRFANALVRQISRTLNDCALLYQTRQRIDFALAVQQFTGYIAALEAAGVRVRVLPEEPNLPDAVFVEDPVVVLDEIAVLCRPANIRLGEVDSIAPAVSELRPVHKILSPGWLEGGDVLRIGRTLFVGISARTNAEGIRQLENIVRPFDYRVVGVAIRDCLHLKTAVTSPGDGLLIANPLWVNPEPFREYEVLTVPDGEPWGANTLAVNGTVFVAASAPETARLLEGRGLSIQRLDISELQKAEAGLTCLSVLF